MMATKKQEKPKEPVDVMPEPEPVSSIEIEVKDKEWRIKNGLQEK